MTELNRVIIQCTDVVKHPKDQTAVQRLTLLSQEISGKASPFWKKLGASLLTLSCLALVVAGVLASVPATGGMSLFLAVATASGLTAGTTAGTAVATLATTGVIGYGMFKTASTKGLAKEVSQLKTLAEKMPADIKGKKDDEDQERAEHAEQP